MALQQSIDLALDANIGAGGLSQAALDEALGLVGEAMKRLPRTMLRAGCRCCTCRAPRTIWRASAKRPPSCGDDATDVVVLGVGGSSLGGQTLAQLKDYAVPGTGRFAESPRIHFLDNLDPITFDRILHKLPLSSTKFVVDLEIRRHGRNPDADHRGAHRAGKGRSALPSQRPVPRHFRAAQGGGKNALRDLLEPEGVRFLEHHTGIGGRYSVLTNVGLLPAAALGLDVQAIRQGAADAYEPFRNGAAAKDAPAALGAALNIAAAKAGKGIAVTMAYADRLERFTRWWVQLWAESVGKDGKGTQPVAAIGPVDQHSQQQLYLAGPNDKLFTVLTTGVAGKGPRHGCGPGQARGPGGLSPARPSATLWPPRAAPWPTPSPRTAARPGRSTSRP